MIPTCQNGHELAWFNISFGHGWCSCTICGARTRADVPNLFDRLWAQSVPEPITGCWLWIGTTNRHGYGQIKVDGKTVSAHRVAYRLSGKHVPTGKHLDHLCRMRSCILPEHLEPTDPVENTRRGCSPVSVVLRTGRCQRGHEMTPDNIVIKPGGWRQCRACVRITNRAAVARYRARHVVVPEMTEAEKRARFGTT